MPAREQFCSHLPHVAAFARHQAGVRKRVRRLERETMVLGWPKRCKLAHAFLWEHSYIGLKLAQLLRQLGVARRPPHFDERVDCSLPNSVLARVGLLGVVPDPGNTVTLTEHGSNDGKITVQTPKE